MRSLQANRRPRLRGPLLARRLDCFASLAMTAKRPCRTPFERARRVRDRSTNGGAPRRPPPSLRAKRSSPAFPPGPAVDAFAPGRNGVQMRSLQANRRPRLRGPVPAGRLDCFASLAMTAKRPCRTPFERARCVGDRYRNSLTGSRQTRANDVKFRSSADRGRTHRRLRRLRLVLRRDPQGADRGRRDRRPGRVGPDGAVDRDGDRRNRT